MSEAFIWSRPNYRYCEVDLEGKIQVPFIRPAAESSDEATIGRAVYPGYLFPPQTPNCKWQIFIDDRYGHLSFNAVYSSSFEESMPASSRSETSSLDYVIWPMLLELSMRNGKGEKVLKQSVVVTKQLTTVFSLSKQEILSECEPDKENWLCFCLKIHCHVEKISPSNVDDNLAPDYEARFKEKKHPNITNRGDCNVTITVRGREFVVNREILSTRSAVFARMFHGPFQEHYTATIEDIEPNVFQKLHQYIDTGRLPVKTMEKMAAALLIASDYYMILQLRRDCERYLIVNMSANHCIELILNFDLINPPEHVMSIMREAANFFRRSQNQVMATDQWKTLEERNPTLLYKILKGLYTNQ